MHTLRIGTRGSQLALYQARTVAALLSQHARAASEIAVIKTSGDRLADASLSEIGGKRLFVKEIQDALLAGSIDLAVHSSKDMPAAPIEGLDVASVLPRENPRDALVLPASTSPFTTLAAAIAALGEAPRLGTSSVRRVAQLAALVPHATFLPIRGNLDTRLRKLDAGEFDAIVLAAAGLRRLDSGARISAEIPEETCVPAPGQGIIAVEIRVDDERTRAAVRSFNDARSDFAFHAERAVVRRLGGGCQMPIGAYASIDGTTLAISGIVVSLDGRRAVRATMSGTVTEATALGTALGECLLERGAGEILREVERAHGAVEGLQP